MKLVLIGQRGVGKSALLKRLEGYQLEDSIAYLDLDLEIEKRKNISLPDIFKLHGEDVFRHWEQEVFRQLTQEYLSFVICLGAGFDVLSLPKMVHKIWVRRETDQLGRVFLDRPQLQPLADFNGGPGEEYQERARLRKIHFASVADEVYWLPEGLTSSNELEKKILSRAVLDCRGILTLFPQHFDPDGNLKMHVQRLKVEFFELRTDLLPESLIRSVVKAFAPERILLSFRNSDTSETLQELTQENILWDWPFEFGPCDFNTPRIVSLHEHPGTLSEALSSLERESPRGVHLKVSLKINTWADLEMLFQWQQKEPIRRSVLPRSENGRWKWFRQRMKGWQLLNFWKDSEGSAFDQPSIFEWMATPPRSVLFAAVLGEPVSHSWTPIEQHAFFAEQRIPVFAVSLDQKEWFQGLSVLQRLGLQSGAVTAPLKVAAFEICEQLTDRAKELQTVNTITRFEGDWSGHNTDWDGFASLWMQAESPSAGKVAIWGGGGTLKMIQSLLPQAQSFSARTGLAHQQIRTLPEYDVVIWAAAPKAALPPVSWKPTLVVDLNYREDSRAREYAQLLGCRYLSGALMFARQAAEQRIFWKGINDGCK